MGDITKKDFRKDDEAFIQVISEYKIDLYRTALAFLKSKERAVEAIQEVTYRAYTKRKQLRELRFVKTWLIRIMINYCNDVIKKEKHWIDDRSLAKEATYDNTTFIWLEEAIQQLKQDDQALIYLKYFHDMTFSELAEQMNLPISTVKTRLYRALTLLRVDLADEGEVLQ